MPVNMYDGMKNIAKVLCVASIVLYCLESVTNSELFFWMYIGAGLLAAAFYGIAGYLRRQANQQNRVSSVAVRLLGRRTERHGRYDHIIKYFLSFRPIEGGARLEFEVSEPEFEAHEQDEVGMLQHRTWEYISFTRDESLRPVNQEKQDV